MMHALSPEQMAARIATIREQLAQALAQQAGCPVEAILVTEYRTITVPTKLVSPDGQWSVTLEPVVHALVESHGPACGPSCPHVAHAPAGDPRPMGTTAAPAPQADGGGHG